MRDPAFSSRARVLLGAGAVLAASGAVGVVLATAGPSGASTTSSIAVQANLQTSLTAGKTWYTEMNQSYDGLNSSTFTRLRTGLEAVDGRTASTSATVISLHVAGPAGDGVIFAASAGAGATCWAIVDLTSNRTLDGFTGPGTLYVAWPKPPKAACTALDFNRTTKSAGETTSTTGFPAG
jgi:hypothetical protein